MNMIPELHGIWLGVSRDEAVVQHLRILRQGDDLFVRFSYDEQPVAAYFHPAQISDGVLHIHSQPPVDVVFVDAEHFVVPNWESAGDMLFCREGLAELYSATAWARYDEIMNRRAQL